MTSIAIIFTLTLVVVILIYVSQRGRPFVRWLAALQVQHTWYDMEWVSVMAQDVAKIMPQAVRKDTESHHQVDYRMLGIRMLRCSKWQQHKAKQLSEVTTP